MIVASIIRWATARKLIFHLLLSLVIPRELSPQLMVVWALRRAHPSAAHFKIWRHHAAESLELIYWLVFSVVLQVVLVVVRQIVMITIFCPHSGRGRNLIDSAPSGLRLLCKKLCNAVRRANPARVLAQRQVESTAGNRVAVWNWRSSPQRRYLRRLLDPFKIVISVLFSFLF